MSKDLERSLKDKVKEIARIQGRGFNDVWKAVVLERFLARLSRSTNLEKLIFKGGFLLSKYIQIGRETADLDFLLVSVPESSKHIKDMINSILQEPSIDGFTFQNLEVEELAQPHMSYPGYEITAVALLGGTKTSIRIDLGVGDQVKPERKNLLLLAHKDRPLFESEISIQVYPLPYIFAEKLEAVVYRGGTNSRMKDFYDLWVLRKNKQIDVLAISEVIHSVFVHRGTPIPNRLSFDSLAIDVMSRSWIRFIDALNDKSKKDIPRDFSEVIAAIDEMLGQLLG